MESMIAPRIAAFTTLCTCLLALSACATQVAPPVSDPQPPATAEAPPMSDPTPPMPVDSCDADAARPAAIGRVATAAVVEQARIDASADMARVIKPGMMVTMEYRAGRLNIDVDENNVITHVRCG
ncbi:I78 family peptidase inhibitor [Lysobacter sp. A3-1-A15]|uniref:I78 family peptidase inhibitor n=1 Tax=Novilysobacter viscosus TaxID=3098602 RepID=UPI002EDA2B31